MCISICISICITTRNIKEILLWIIDKNKVILWRSIIGFALNDYIFFLSNAHIDQEFLHKLSMISIQFNLLFLSSFNLFYFPTAFKFLIYYKYVTFLQYLHIRSRSNYFGIFFICVRCFRPLHCTKPITIFSFLL